MKNLYILITLLVFLNGCVAAGGREKPTVKPKLSDSCQVVANQKIKGQIRYFDGMNLRLPSCPIIENWEFENKSTPVGAKIISALNLDPLSPESDFLYVNIEFYASTTPNGKVTIHDVVTAELTDASIYD